MARERPPPRALATTAAATTATRLAAVVFVFLVVGGFAFVVIIVCFVGLVVRFHAVFDEAVLDCGDVVLFAGVDFLDPGFVVVLVVLVVRLIVVVEVFRGAQRGLFFGVRLLFGEQRVAILLRDLVVVGMDLVEGEEAVPVAAEIDERRLKRRFDPRDLG